jgi:hypothetical protein
MEYNCQKVPLCKILLDKKGKVCPLCDTCRTKYIDCENPIELKKVMMFDQIEEHFVFSKRGEFFFVVGCEAYSELRKVDEKRRKVKEKEYEDAKREDYDDENDEIEDPEIEDPEIEEIEIEEIEIEEIENEDNGGEPIEEE